MERIYKNSKKRNAIYEVLCGTKEHPSAEWVYSRLKPDFPDLSLGTVYRNLSFFKELGTIVSLGVIDGQERFDANTQPHAHFVCGSCGRVLDIEFGDEKIRALYGAVEKTLDVQIDSHHLIFHGKCVRCTPESPIIPVQNQSL